MIKYYWCFKCQKYIHNTVEHRKCNTCGEVLSFNTFSRKDVERYEQLIKKYEPIDL